MVAVPLLATMGFATLTVAGTTEEATRADEFRALVAVSDAAGELAEALQTERFDAVQLLLERPGFSTGPFQLHMDETDAAAAEFARIRGELANEPQTTESVLNRIEQQLEGLPSLRELILSGGTDSEDAVWTYRTLILDLGAYRDTVAVAGGATADTANRARAAAALASALEQSSYQEVVVQRVLDSNQLTVEMQDQINVAQSGYIEGIWIFTALATPEWREKFDEASSDRAAILASDLETRISKIVIGHVDDINYSDWTELMDLRVARLQELVSTVDADILDEVTDLRDQQRIQAMVQSALVLIVVVLAIMIAMWLGRPVVRGLHRLRDAANQVATVDLPEAVARLGDHEVLGDLTPEQFAERGTRKVPMEGKDELTEVARAFNAVHSEAVRVAAEQALMRAHIASMFVELARRGNSLTGRLTAALDDAERKEQNPEWLERLFTFDHMVTLLARRNNSLLVLGGASPALARVEEESIADVLQAAQGQVEHYTRIHIIDAGEGMAIKAQVVDEVVILLAELMDNATRYSQNVYVGASVLTDRVVIQITDNGVGIEPEQRQRLNARLAYPALDLEALRSMGLTVVGTIAARHRIQVELRENQPRGTLAQVTLPIGLLTKEEPKADLDGSRSFAPLFQKRRKPRPSPRPPKDVDEKAAVASLAGPVTTQDTIVMPAISGEEPEAVSAPPEPQVPSSGETAAPAAVPPQRAPLDAPPPNETTASGLPVRAPMAHLVPGGIEDTGATTVNSDYRDPNVVGATFAAFARGTSANMSSTTTTTEREPHRE